MGEGWHNNHHYYQGSCRQGFFWWEFDPSYYVLKTLALFGIVWNIRPVPVEVKYGSKRLDGKKPPLKG
jgi:stearoyl-CoA desaturase (delta-9 desaturase)